MRVLFFSEVSPESGSFFYRVLSPIDGLVRSGHLVRHTSSIRTFKEQLEIFKPHFVVYYKPLFTEFFEAIRELTIKHATPLLYDIDDLSYDSSIIEQSKIFDFAKHEIDSGTARNMESYKRAILSCDGVIVSTESLYDEVKKIHKNVFLVNNYFPDSYFEYIRAEFVKPKKKKILYTGSSVLHGMFLEEIHTALYYMLSQKKELDFELMVCGGIRLPALFDRFSNRIIYRENMDFREYLKTLNLSSVVVAPIFKDRFTLCKSWIKVLEPELAGIPWVASSHPEYIKVAKNSKMGSIANGFYAWVDRLEAALSLDLVKTGINETLLSSNCIEKEYEQIMLSMTNRVD